MNIVHVKKYRNKERCLFCIFHFCIYISTHICGARFCPQTQLPILLFSPLLPLFSFFATCAISTPHLCGHVKVNELWISGNGFNSHAEKIHKHAWMPLAELSRNYKTKFRNFEVDKWWWHTDWHNVMTACGSINYKQRKYNWKYIFPLSSSSSSSLGKEK